MDVALDAATALGRIRARGGAGVVLSATRAPAAVAATTERARRPDCGFCEGRGIQRLVRCMRLVVCTPVRAVRVVRMGAGMVGTSGREMYRAARQYFGKHGSEFGDAGEDVFVIGGWGDEDGGCVKVRLDFGASPGRTLSGCRAGTELVVRDLADGAGAIVWTAKMRWMGIDRDVTYRCGRNRRRLHPGEQPTLPRLKASHWGTRRIPKSCRDLKRREMGYCSAGCVGRKRAAAKLTFLG